MTIMEDRKKIDDEVTKITGINTIQDKEYIKIRYKRKNEYSGRMIKSKFFKLKNKIL